VPDRYGPFDAAPGQPGSWNQAEWYRDAYARGPSGVYGNPVQGVTTNGDLPLTVNGLTVSVGLGRAHVRGAGYERTGTPWTDTVPANTAGTPRVDRIVLRRDLAAKTVTPVRLQGTPAASPAKPALTRSEDGAWDEPLFSFTVPANSGTTLTGLTDERRWIDPGGGGYVPVTAQLYQTATTSLPNGAWTPIPFQTGDYDEHNGHSTTVNPTRYVVPYDLVVRVSGVVHFAGNDTGRRGVRWNYAQTPGGTPTVVNNSVGAMLPARGIGAVPATPHLFTIYAGGWIEMQALQDSGAALSTFISPDSASMMLVESVRFL